MQAMASYMQQGQALLQSAWEHYASRTPLALDALEAEKTAGIVVDMVRGFAQQGPLSSPRVGALSGEIALFCRHLQVAGMQMLLFADVHPADSPEFEAFPPHCMEGTDESQMIDALAAFGPVIEKSSSNGLLEPLFMAWLDEHQSLDTFIITGDCTDICILQFAVTLKALFNRLGRKSRIIVPAALTDTYDAPGHGGDAVKILSLYYMQQLGIEIPSHIVFS